MDLSRILQIVEDSLDDPELAAGDLAGRAYLSRFHFDRLVRAALGEPPGTFRRRLLLERAAYRLATGTDQVIDVARDAGYGSPDAFTRAFVRGFGRTPSGYRDTPPHRHDLPAGNGIHFHPPGGLRLPADTRRTTMDVLIRMYDHHVQLTADIIDRLAQVPDETLDRPITLSVEGIDENPTLRSVTDRLVRQLEMWVIAVDGGASIPAGAGDVDSLRSRLNVAATGFRDAVIAPIVEGEADRTFLDATCEPPQTFSLGGVLAHVLTFSAVRRTLAVGALDSAGIDDLGAGDPMAYVGGQGPDASQVIRNFE